MVRALAVASRGGLLPGLAGLVLMALQGVLTGMVDIFFYAILAQAILSWVNPFHPVYAVLAQLSSPILRPLSRLLPPIQGFDLSSLVALILLQMVGHIVLPGLFASLH